MSSRSARNRQRKRKSEEEFRRIMEEQETREREERTERLERIERIQNQIRFDRLERERKARFERFERIRRLEDERRMMEQEKRAEKNRKLEEEGRLEELEDEIEKSGKLEEEKQLDKNEKTEKKRKPRVRSVMKREKHGNEWIKKVAARGSFGLFVIWLLAFFGCFLYDGIRYNTFVGSNQFSMEQYEEMTYDKGVRYLQGYVYELLGRPIAEFYDRSVERFDASIYTPFRQYFGIPDDVNAAVYLLETGGMRLCIFIDEVVFPVVKYLFRVIHNVMVFIIDAGYILIFDVVVPWWMED